MKIKLTGEGLRVTAHVERLRVTAHVERLDAIIKADNDFFIRRGQYEYEKLKPQENSQFHLWLSNNPDVKPGDLTTTKVDEIIAPPIPLEGGDKSNG